jgi:hypothetical protein
MILDCGGKRSATPLSLAAVSLWFSQVVACTSSMKPWKWIGWLLVVSGISISVFSDKIVFPGLERLVGIETIVGAENVVYQADGSYLFTNPGAMARWVLSVAAIGILLVLSGALILIRSKRK